MITLEDLKNVLILLKSKHYFLGYLTYGVCAVQVEVNGLTGQVDVLSADLVMDLGHPLNPGIDVGQIEGAFVQGMGMVTTEQLISDTKVQDIWSQYFQYLFLAARIFTR